MAPDTLIIQIAISIILPLSLYLCFSKRSRRQFPGIHFLIKRWWAEWCIAAKEETEKTNYDDYEKDYQTNPSIIKDENSCESILFYGADQKGNSLFVKYARRGRRIAEVSLQFTTTDGRIYVLADYPNTVVTSSFNQKWSAAGLRIEQLELRKRWRITYNGVLRNLTMGRQPRDENNEHVRLNFIFIGNERPLLWPADWSRKLHADALAQEPWKSPEWMHKVKSMDYKGFDQWGGLVGQATFKDSSVSELYFRGLSQRRWGKHESDQFHKAAILFGAISTGAICYLGAADTKQSFSRMRFGHFKGSDEKWYTINWLDPKLSSFSDGKCNVDSKQRLCFAASKKEHNVDIKFGNSITLYHGSQWNWANKIVNVKLKLNGKTGFGIMQLWQPYSGPCNKKAPREIRYITPPSTCIQRDDYVLFFDDGKCQNENIVGGKGFSLAALSSIEDADFTVPKGLCVTIFALELQLQTHEELQRLIDDIENISGRKKAGNLKAHCEKTVRIIESTSVVKPVSDAVLTAIEKLESSPGDERDQYRYAIRSSAVGEDSADTSAAGQNSTYLGVSRADDIIKSVAKCWASLYSFQSVEYRRQHGLPVKASMGVCVQKMVNAEVAGVMFTRHPTTGDPSNILITANYGLGETVVSAVVEPDTITVYRSWDDKLNVKDTVIGKKTHKISISNSGVDTSRLDEKETRQVCISESIALRLAAIGLHIEASFGSARDIEWAVSDEKIFLLQARPITSLYTWTDFELTHELDTSVPSDTDILSFANTGEVFPNPVSPLSMSTSAKAFNNSAVRQNNDGNRNYIEVLAWRLVLNYYNSFMRNPGKKLTLVNKAIDMAICGKLVVTPEIHKTALERNGTIKMADQISMIWKVMKGAWQSSAVVKQSKEIYRDLIFNEDDFHTAYSLYHEINHNLTYIDKVSDCHTLTTSASVVCQMLAMTLLMTGYEDFAPDHFTDIAIVLSTCSNIVSSEVPILMSQIAYSIKDAGKAEEFRQINPSSAQEWLKSNCPPAAQQLEKFFEVHGHRCVQELDLYSDSWSMKPEKLIVTIQALTQSSEEYKASKKLSVEETVASLKTPKSVIIKWLLKKIMPLCRDNVEARETTKSMTSKVLHKFKLAYRKLGTLTVSEGYLPHDELVFFLTHEEIGHLLRNRSSNLAQKAQRRKRLYLRLAELEYPELNFGTLTPIKAHFDTTVFEQSATVQGTSVCAGSVLGRACVITNISDAESIQQGDILITHATDIAWSPYFPLLRGVVTELGGLISHGAVVAREYGIPCVVGATGATLAFETGDTVLLAADVGAVHFVNKA